MWERKTSNCDQIHVGLSPVLNPHQQSNERGPFFELSPFLLFLPPHPSHPKPSIGELTSVLHWGPEAPKGVEPSNIIHTPSLFSDIFVLKVLLGVWVPGPTAPGFFLWDEGPPLSFHRPPPLLEHHHLLITVIPMGIGEGWRKGGVVGEMGAPDGYH